MRRATTRARSIAVLSADPPSTKRPLTPETTNSIGSSSNGSASAARPCAKSWLRGKSWTCARGEAWPRRTARPTRTAGSTRETARRMHRTPSAWSHRAAHARARARGTRRTRTRTLKDGPPRWRTRNRRRSGIDRTRPGLRHDHATSRHCRSVRCSSFLNLNLNRRWCLDNRCGNRRRDRRRGRNRRCRNHGPGRWSRDHHRRSDGWTCKHRRPRRRSRGTSHDRARRRAAGDGGRRGRRRNRRRSYNPRTLIRQRNDSPWRGSLRRNSNRCGRRWGRSCRGRDCGSGPRASRRRNHCGTLRHAGPRRRLSLFAFENRTHRVAGLGDAGEIEARLGLNRRTSRSRRSAAALEVAANTLRLILVDRARVGLASHTQRLERIQNRPALYFQFPCQIVNAYFTHPSLITLSERFLFPRR